MNDYTPTTEKVRDAYVIQSRQAFIASAGEHAEEFDRWLAKTIQEALDGVGVPTEPGLFTDNEGGRWRLTPEGVWLFEDQRGYGFEWFVSTDELAAPKEYLPFRRVEEES